MSVGNSEEALNSRHACASCKHQRRKCESDCVFAPHFPASRVNYFREVHKIFGVKNMIGIFENLSLQERKKAVESLEWEAFAWKEDPVQGPLGLFRKLERELELLKNQQTPQQNIVMPYQTKSGLIAFNQNSDGIVANNSINATNFGYANNPNSLLDVNMNNYAGFLQSADNIENRGLGNYIPVGPYHPVPQGQGRSVILQKSGLDAVAQTSTLLPKHEMQRNPILWPAANSFNQGPQQRGSKARFNAHLDDSVSGSQWGGLH